jgi:hypothetical protein
MTKITNISIELLKSYSSEEALFDLLLHECNPATWNVS